MRALHRYGLSGGLVAAAAVTVLGTGALVEAFLWPSSAPTSAARPPGAAAAPSPAGRPDAVAQQIGSAPAPPPSGAPPRPAGSAQSRTAAVPLTARFARGPDGGLAGYPATVTVANQGAATVSGWTVTLTLPRVTLGIADVEGATVTRDGAAWTFIPTAATVKVGPASSVTVSFRVSGAALLDADPTACRIDANPCQGVG
ncbi:cellulose binding domain-containing protein [Dactylosporangium sp. McL0621]|uniref:cellulose binding domain-containing protein n=1 Tax=Dactylosporangium sp. McL0621 TaxID=3415678 RepID=UPI003CF69458